MRRSRLAYLPPVIGAVLFLVAAWILHHELTGERFSDLVREVRTASGRDLVLATMLAGLSYFVITLYDAVALRLIGRPLQLRRTVFASFIGYAFSHNLGFALITGAGVRYRIYGSWGLNAVDTAFITGFGALTLLLGASTVIGASLFLRPSEVAVLLPLSRTGILGIGLALLVLCLAYVFFAQAAGRLRWLSRFGLPLPRPRIAALQIGLGVVDWALAASVLWVLLPVDSAPSFLSFLPIFTLAACAGLISHVPGGLGVFESIILLALPAEPSTYLLASLVLYRGIYYLLPLLVAAIAFGVHELLRRAGFLAETGQQVGRAWTAIAPNIFAILIFVAGAVLLVSAVLPISTDRIFSLRRMLPLSVLEFSHFAASLIGMAMLIIASGLRRRLDAAYLITLGLLIAGAIATLLKALRVEEAGLLLLLFLLLLPCRSAFYRRTRMTTGGLTGEWILAVAMVIVAMIGIGMFVYAHVDYREELWWRFAFFADAPRFLRAAAGALAALLLAGLWFLFRGGRPERLTPSVEDLARAEPIIARSSGTQARLALAGDKALLFSRTGHSFIMYGVEGRSWVALGDPVGPAEERLELLWEFCELCDGFDGWPVFYQVPPESLPLYVELGLAFQKIGEQAYVPLGNFSLDGERMKELRQRHHRLVREGFSFAILAPEEGARRIESLRRISEAWLGKKTAREKRFSMGMFTPDYLRHFPIALVKRNGEELAFANVLASADRAELSIDLMRFNPAAGRGIMDFLFVELILFAQREGYQRFDLGVAPLSGLDARRVASLWSRTGTVIYRHGEHFYNFRGLRQYKAKFYPDWAPRYLASPGGLALPAIAANLTTLIAGGTRGVVMR